MQRYFVEPAQWQGEMIVLGGQDAHHLQRVMRARIGEKVFCSDGAGREALAEVAAFAGENVELRVVEWLVADREPQVEVWIAQALPKGDKLETVWQKCTEMGATRLIPFVPERTVVQYDAKKEAKRAERWQKIVKEAAEQAHRSRVPVVELPRSWQQVLALAGEVDAALFCYEKAETVSLKQALREARGNVARRADVAGRDDSTGDTGLRRVLVVVGPEGGFAEKEAAAAEAAGMRAITLGRRILRTETAALVALSCILYECDELGGT